jgi:M6 family metalloprotease-like protein
MGKFAKGLLVAVFVLGSIQTPAYAAVKAGASCTKSGQTTTSGGYKYACKKQGKKLVWVKGEKTNSPANSATGGASGTASNANNKLSKYSEGDACPNNSGLTPGYRGDGKLVYLSCGPDGHLHPQNGAPELNQQTGLPIPGPLGLLMSTTDYLSPANASKQPTTPQSAASEYSSVELCKIPDAGVAGEIVGNPQRHFTSGFGPYPERAKLMKNPVIQFLPVDFSDLPGQRSPVVDYQTVKSFLKQYWEQMGYGKTKIEVRIPSEYLRLPKTVMEYDLASDFFVTGKPPTGTFNYARAAIAAYDSQIDFSDVDIIAVVPPAEVTRKQIGGFTAEAAQPGGGFNTSEKTVFNVLISAGPHAGPAEELLNWAHETGHMFGLTDARNTKNVSQQDSSDLGVFDLMSSPIATELLAWNRYLIGALSDSQVRCVAAAGTTTTLISPIERTDTGTKLVVIPTGKYTGIAIESRRAYGFDSNLGSAAEGLIVYRIDTRVPYGLSPFKIVGSPTSTDNSWLRDAALHAGSTMVVDGIEISNLESGDFGDVVKVSKK